MTALEKWVTEIAAETVKDDEMAGREITTTIEQRLGVALVQARAHELRHLAGELQVLGVVRHPVLRQYWKHLMDRSSALEKIALDLCEKWPPDSKPAEEPRLTLVQ